MLRDQLPDAVADGVQLLGGRQAVRDCGGATRLVLAPQAGHADLEELVQVGREDREELDALEERVAGVAGLVEDARVELDPRQLAVEDRTLLVARGPASATAGDAGSGCGSNGGHGPLAVALAARRAPELTAASPGPGRVPENTTAPERAAESGLRHVPPLAGGRVHPDAHRDVRRRVHEALVGRPEPGLRGARLAAARPEPSPVRSAWSDR